MRELHKPHILQTQRPVTFVTFVQLVRLKAEAGCRLFATDLGAAA
ncbi:hypothetical protein [Sphingomonas sp.]|jgi:hypothetical protein|nr:hypothetical protein [Sphingomonas sp.]